MSLLPAKYTFTVWEGSTWRKTITVLSAGPGSTAQDLTGYIASMTIRTAADTAPVYTLSTTNGQITLGGTAGTVSLYIPAVDTLTFDAWGSGLYELTITASNGTGDVQSLMWGPIVAQGIA